MSLSDRESAGANTGWTFFDRGLIDAASALQHFTGEPALAEVPVALPPAPPALPSLAVWARPPVAVAVSDVTLTEVARLLRDGRLVPGAAGPAAWLDAFALCFHVLPVNSRVAWTAAAFDWPHRDPCDRHILATAVVHGLPLMTVDPAIAAFAPSVGVVIVW